MTLQKHMRKKARAKVCCLSGHVVEPFTSWVQQQERCRRAAVGRPQLVAKFKRQKPARHGKLHRKLRASRQKRGHGKHLECHQRTDFENIGDLQRRTVTIAAKLALAQLGKISTETIQCVDSVPGEVDPPSLHHKQATMLRKQHYTRIVWTRTKEAVTDIRV